MWTFIVELAGKLAWPAVTLFLAVYFRKSLSALVDRVKRLKQGDNEVEFDVPRLEVPKDGQGAPQKQLPAPADEAPVAEPEPAPAAEPALVDYAPDGAIVNAWARFEETLRREALRIGLVDENERANLPTLLDRHRKLGTLSEENYQAAQAMRRIRNEVVHLAKRPTTEAATQFVTSVEALIAQLEAESDGAQLDRLLSSLRAQTVHDVRVGTMAAIGVSASETAAAEMARFRQGKWAAASHDVETIVSERDAALLLRHGATLVRDPEARARTKFKHS